MDLEYQVEKPGPRESDVQKLAAEPVKITVSLIARRNLSHPSAGTTEDMVQKMLKLTHVRLDRENIREIDHMEVLGPVTNMYLQQNSIARIDNLESLMDLRFLVLSGNQIETVENLCSLDRLQFLDLSENKITDFDAVNPRAENVSRWNNWLSHYIIPEEFPKSLTILNLADNPCCLQADHRQRLIRSLPNLKQLDGRSITSQERREAGQEVTTSGSEDDQSEDDEEESYHKSLNELLHLSAGLVSQSKHRSRNYRSLHDEKMAAIAEVRAQSRQAMSTPELMPRGSRSRFGST